MAYSLPFFTNTKRMMAATMQKIPTYRNLSEDTPPYSMKPLIIVKAIPPAKRMVQKVVAIIFIFAGQSTIFQTSIRVSILNYLIALDYKKVSDFNTSWVPLNRVSILMLYFYQGSPPAPLLLNGVAYMSYELVNLTMFILIVSAYIYIKIIHYKDMNKNDEETKTEGKETKEGKTFWEKAKDLPPHDKLFAFLIVFNLIFSITTAFILPALQPHPNTEVIQGGEDLLIQQYGGDKARWDIRIKNTGDDEAEGVSLEVEFPDGSTIDWQSGFIGWEGNWSRKPDYLETEDNYFIMRWQFLPAHAEIYVDVAVDLTAEYPPDAEVEPNHVLVTAKGERSPIHEYP